MLQIHGSSMRQRHEAKKHTEKCRLRATTLVKRGLILFQHVFPLKLPVLGFGVRAMSCRVGEFSKMNQLRGPVSHSLSAMYVKCDKPGELLPIKRGKSHAEHSLSDTISE